MGRETAQDPEKGLLALPCARDASGTVSCEAQSEEHALRAQRLLQSSVNQGQITQGLRSQAG